MNEQASIVRTGRKFDQVLEGAREVFMADGFEGASVDDIARAAGVSKATLYSYFPDKRLLFMEVARNECARQADAPMDLAGACCTPRDVLCAAGRHILSVSLSEFGLRMFRICVAEADRFPDLGRQFYESGPMVVRARLRDYLKGAAARGELQIEDFDLAADQFAELCRADLVPRLIFNIDTEFSAEERERVIAGAVELFLARYGG
ncbi:MULTISPECIES: TetR/AcrR family transcriptional regulator [Rhodobacterales]|jgi:AcrR family transcriptional regulator|uniref:TetR family transcriptional regulator n=1 Tax=Phaeobacter gallaeciensis TaxID=60890 RepID=A0A1B0ZR98_9RHOB|nr:MULTISPECIES: TetR/AcrR family transcriptional regulator [Phaeobacter]MDF1771892.1 TetR/AcrR family transcriptional regulator [Pseudophaeobacter sp. bin_em_oilr2.035]MEE2632969.1 TetR/AcrR family transcriptional regulator [Pseudomonadota bacterium]ANP36693.1 TetR family transcriptional regulator [Phaeobacter gallaeciensis]MDE4060379.1 TetR/AcrR family transcriptional regulator [Phaeobacter gallaeciensis]MDE4098501.1 TetR/AcrR family transcriptional regulator [Phaeobacter gallaeciensis]